MIKPLLVGTFVAVVVLTECLFAYFLIPSSADVENWAREKSTAQAGKGGRTGKDAQHSHTSGSQGGHDGEDGQGGESGEHVHAVEVELGKFNVVIHQPAANLTMR